MIDFGKEPGLKELFSRKWLGDQFKEEIEKIIAETKEISDCWELSTLKTLGKRKSSVYASFKLKKEIFPANKRIDEYFHLRDVLSTKLEKLFWFTITIRYVTTRASGTLMFWYHPLRKKDPELLKYQTVINYSYVEMVRKNPDLQEELKNTNYFEWIYDLNIGSSGTYSVFNSSTFSFSRIYLRRDFVPHNRSKFIRIPSLGALKGRLFKFKDDNAIRDGFRFWLKKNEISSIDHEYNSIIALFLKFFMEVRYNKRWNHSLEEWFLIPHEFQVNEFLTLRLEHYQTNIYVNGKLFNQCKFLLLNIPKAEISDYDEIESIDEAAEKLDRRNESNKALIPAETEFWGHCSNLQAWHENDYDTRLLHRNLAFPLLKELTRVGDPRARKVFKEEIAMRLESGHDNVISFLIMQGYLGYLNTEELSLIFENAIRMGNIILVEKVINLNFTSKIRFQKFGPIQKNSLYCKNLFSRSMPLVIQHLQTLIQRGFKQAKFLYKLYHDYLLERDDPSELYFMLENHDKFLQGISNENMQMIIKRLLEISSMKDLMNVINLYFPKFLIGLNLTSLTPEKNGVLKNYPLLLRILKHHLSEISLLYIRIFHSDMTLLVRLKFHVSTEEEHDLDIIEQLCFSELYEEHVHFDINDENFIKIKFRSNYPNYLYYSQAKYKELTPIIHVKLHEFLLHVLGKGDITIYFRNVHALSLPGEVVYYNTHLRYRCAFIPKMITIKELSERELKQFKRPNHYFKKKPAVMEEKYKDYKKITDFLKIDKNKEVE